MRYDVRISRHITLAEALLEIVKIKLKRGKPVIIEVRASYDLFQSWMKADPILSVGNSIVGHDFSISTSPGFYFEIDAVPTMQWESLNT